MNKRGTVVLSLITLLTLAFMTMTLGKKCTPPSPLPDASSPDAASPDASDASDTDAAPGSTVAVVNTTVDPVVVYFAFGADSVVLPAAWPFCTSSARLTCQFTLPGHGTQPLPLGGKYLNTTFAFDARVSCGSTKAELNINNPKWYDIADVSLVDGYSNKISITVGAATLGPPVGAAGNEKVLGVFPLGCDICTARQNPPCGMKPGTDGCKTGTQYKPDVPCQYQGSKMGGGSEIIVSYLGN
jgi:hypothetical protein